MQIESYRDGPWELPEGWVWARLGDLCKFPARIDPARELEGQFRYIDLSAVEDGKITQPQTLPVGRAPSRARQAVRAGDTLLSCVRVYLQNNAIVPDELDSSVASTAFCVLRPSEAIDPLYLYWFVHSGRFMQVLIPLQRGNSPPAVLDDDVRDQFIPIAPLAEQRRIVARIDELFTEIADGEAALARASADLDTWRRALLKAAVTGELTREWRKTNRLNESGEDVIRRIKQALTAIVHPVVRRNRKSAEEQIEIDLASLPELPDSWAWSRIGDIGRVTGGLTKNPDRSSAVRKLPYLRVANVQYGELDLSDVREIGVDDAELERVLLQSNDLLIVEGNGSIDQIGRCAMWTNKISPCVHQNHIIKVRFGEVKLALWAFHWLMSPHGRQLITKVASSTSGLHTLSISKIESVPVPVPPTGERDQILSALTDESDSEGTVEVELSGGTRSLSSLRQSTLKAAFEGSLVPQDPRDEPAEQLLARLNAPSGPPPPSRRRTRGNRVAATVE